MKISKQISLDLAEIKYTFITSPGPGGQNVNKVATAVLLRFNITHSPSLEDDLRERLLTYLGKRVTAQGDILIKASRFRTQNRNKEDALERLKTMIQRVALPPKKRKKTKPTYAATERRLNRKKLQGKKKALRRHEGKE